MKDITLKITGRQLFEQTDEAQLEFVTDGKFYTRNNAAYVVYDESEVSGLEGCKTTLRITDDSVKMKRTGEVGYGTELYFKRGERFTSSYDTPYGPMSIEVLTRSVINNIDREAGCGNVDIEYDISLQGRAEGKNCLTIDIM